MLDEFLGQIQEKRERALQMVGSVKIQAGDHLRAVQNENAKVTKKLDE
jgi:hypothetical protein